MRFLPAVILLLCASAARAEKLNGFNMPCWWKDCYGKPSTAASLSKMAQTGAGWVALTPSWLMPESTSAEISPADSTPDDEGLRAAMRAAKAAGLKVALKPHVDAKDVRARSLIHSRDPQRWFAAYRVMMGHYARLAAEERADMLVIGTELFLMSGNAHRAQWERVIKEARAVYPGPMTYAANWYGVPKVSFWDKLDYIGVDGYFPLLSGGPKWAMKLEWEAYKPLIALEAAGHGKPVLFTEFGIASQKGAQRKPWEWTDFGPLDLQVQKNYFESFLEVFGTESWFAGIWQWGWEINPDAGGPADKSMTVQGKPALESLKAYFAKTRSAPKGLSPAQKLLMSDSVERALAAPLKF